MNEPLSPRAYGFTAAFGHPLGPEGWQLSVQDIVDAKPLALIESSTGAPCAALLARPAESSSLARHLGLREAALGHSFAVDGVWLAPGANARELLPALLYLAAREARIAQRHTLLLGLTDTVLSSQLAELLQLEPITGLSARAGVRAYAQETGRAAYLCDAAANPTLRRLIRELAVDEVERCMEGWLASFYAGSWARAVLDRTLTRRQYTNSLCDIYQFVRHTTRIAARAVVHSDARDIRTHYLNHLRGEINHEILIERDLEHLGYDVDYLVHAHVQHVAMHRFIALQESTIGYQQAPTLLLACPMVAEGMTANMDPAFIECLREQISSWGIERPRKAMTFLESHIHTDGGDDGHWQMVLDAVATYVRDELTLQRFLLVMRSAMGGYKDGFDHSIESAGIWAATQGS